MDESSLSHTKWICKYHIIFIPKYRRKEIYGKLRKDIGEILRQLCQYPKLAVSKFVGYLKGKSTLMIYERHANLKYKHGNRHFWARGYYVSTVGLNQKAVEEYIRNQEKEDRMYDQISFKEFDEPFKKVK